MRLRFICFLFGLFFCNQAFSFDYYKRHFIVLIDRTDGSMDEDPNGMKEVGKILSNFFLGKNDYYDGVSKGRINQSETYLPNMIFDPLTDEISLFKFGTNAVDRQLPQIANKVKKGIDPLTAVVNELIIPVGKPYQKSGKLISQFIETDFKPLFSGKEGKNVNLSSIVYPCVLKKIEIDPPASEYYVIIIGNLKTIKDHEDNKADYGVINTAMGAMSGAETKDVRLFKQQLWDLRFPFYTSELMRIQTLNGVETDSKNPIKAIKAVCYQLGLKSLQGVSSYITSNLSLHETDVDATTYDLEEVNISFNKDETLDVDKLIMNVYLGNEQLYSKNVLDDAQYNDGEKSYHVTPMSIDLGRVFEERDSLKFEYLFYTRAIDSKGNDILPIVYSTERNYVVTEDTLESPKEQQRIMAARLIGILITLALLGVFALFIRRKRGQSRRAGMEFNIWPISHERYMNVKDKKVVAYDCWYWRSGEKDKSIPITGRLILEEKKFIKRYNYKVEVQVQDVDDNEDFTFRPDPTTFRNKHGDDPIAMDWYEVPLKEDGTFSFSANSFLVNSDKTPDFIRENILKMKVTLRIVRKEKGKDRFMETLARSYSFIVRPEIDNRNIWVAFDPGTTGSCVAYGASANPTDTNDIYLAENEYETLNDGTGKSHIYPSMIRLNHKSRRLFNNEMNADELNEGENQDFLFGNSASILWDVEGVNCFQSIKKLLGYTDKYKIVKDDGNVQYVSGQDIAHLLVKGLYNNVQAYIEKDNSVPENIRELFVKNGRFTPQRAIVAVPNNYTLVKIQDMVDTVKRTRKFKEVHFIYEAEAVMMMYFRQCWSELPKLKNKIFVVYDMGGATINATAFKLNVIMGLKNRNSFIRRIEVETISKIGYGIGGDDIDYALIQLLYDIPSVKEYLMEHDVNIEEHQRLNKVKLIQLVRELKLEIIARDHHETSGISHFSNVETFYGHVRGVLYDMGIKIDSTPWEEDCEYIGKIIDVEQLKQNTRIVDSIYRNVEDAIDNLLSSIDSADDVELIMSGRSVLFPGIQEKVIESIEDNGFNCHRWEGFDDKNGFMSAEKVKVAVATGACWYAMYSGYILLKNKRITSSFGYIDMINHKQKYVPVVQRTDEFTEDGSIRLESETMSPLNDVKFVQMLGAEEDWDAILEEDIKHKYNVLDEVRPGEIQTSAEKIIIYVDDKGNFSYKIQLQGKTELFEVKDNPYSRLSKTDVKTEIVNENSRSYIFSTLNLLQTDSDAIRRFLSRINRQSGQKRRF